MAPKAIDPAKARILFIDGDAGYGLLTCKLLQGRVFGPVQFVVSGAEGLERLGDFPAEVVVVDLVTEGMAGFDVVRALRDPVTSPRPGVAVVMTGEDADRETVARAIRTGADHFFAKPLAADALAERLKTVLLKPLARIQASGYFGPCRRRLPDASYTGPERRE